MRIGLAFTIAALFATSLFADGETHYYLRGSDGASDMSSFDGHGSTFGWAETPGGGQVVKAATDATGIYHLNGFILRAKLSGSAYTFQGGELLFDKAGSAINNKMASNATLTIGNLRVASGVHAELRQGDNGNTSKWAGANWVVEEGAILGFSVAEANTRYHVSSATITGRGLVALTSGINANTATGGSLTLDGGMAGFEGFLSAYERGASFTGTYAAGTSGKQLVIAAPAGFPLATPNGALLERSIIVTNGATLSFTCDVMSPIMRGWDFGDGAQPTVNVDAGKTVYVHGPVKGSAGFQKTGAGTLVLDVGGEGKYDTITLTGAATVDAATLDAYVVKCDQYIAALAGSAINVTSAYTADGLPDVGLHDDLEDGVSYTYTAPAFISISDASRARCTGWSLYDGDGTLLRTSSSQGETTLSCTIAYSEGDFYNLAWDWTTESASTLAAPSATISGRTFTLSGSLTSLGVGTTHILVKWDEGDWTDVATFDAVSPSTAFSSTHTGTWGETSAWQVMCSNVCDGVAGPATAFLVSAPVSGTCFQADGATYTWTGRGGDDLWTNPDNWRDNRDGDCLGYPDSPKAYAIFPALGAPYAVEVPHDLSVKKMTFDSPDVTLTGVGASVPKITPAENSVFEKMTLDHVEVYRFADHTIGAGQTVHLRNGAKATINNCKLNAAGGTSLIRLEGGSTIQVNGLWLGSGNEVVIDDSEFISTAAFCLGDTADGGKIVFKGAAPKMTLRGTAFCGANMNGSNVSLEFHLPAGGYTSAPITTTGNYYFFGAPNGAKTGNVTLNVVSAEGDGTGEYTCPLVAWQKGFDTNGHLVLGSLPASASSASFAFADAMAGQAWTDGSTISATAKSLGVHVVAPQTEAPAWTDFTSPDGFWTANADGNGNVVFSFDGGESALLRHWQDGHGRYLESTATMTLPLEEAAGVIPVISRVWHVAANGSDANDGATEATAKATLGAGYALLSSVGDRLHVHPGTYLNETSMYATNGWQIIGVGGASATTINVASNFTSFRFVKDKGGEMGVVRGFTIAPANGVRQAHQAVNQKGWGLFADCVVTNLGTTKDDVAIRQQTVDCVISNCVFHGCQSSGATGSTIQQWTAGKIIDCKFFDCAGSNGRYGGAVSVGNAGSVVRGCLFVNCANTGTGGAISFYGAGLVENCTIIGCRSTGTTTGAGGIDVFTNPGTVRNCIVYGCENDAGEANINATKGIAVEYTATAPLFDGTGNILLATMPKFADAAGGDYRVTAGATIDAGLNQSWMADAPDLAGNPRLQNGAVDMGAYEYDPDGAPLSVSIVASDVAALLGSPITLSANVMPSDSTGLTYSWIITDHNTGATVLTRSGADCATFAYAYPLGQYDVAVTVADGQSQTASDALEGLFSVKPETVWVNNAATEAYPYDTKATGFTNAVDAVAFAENGMTIVLADGVQTNKITDVIVLKAVTVRGESGDSGRTALYTTKMLQLNHPGAAVRGLTLRSDYKSNSYVSIVQGTLDSCVVTNYSRGNCTVSISPGGMMTNCLVTGCANTGRDCFIGVGDAGSVLVDTKIVGNRTTNGSYNEIVRVSNGLVRGCLIAGNESNVGSGKGAVYLTGSGTVENCTIVGNTEATTEPIVRIGNASGMFRNCIVVGNANKNGPSGVGGDHVSKATYTLCDVAGLTGAGCRTEADPAKVFKRFAAGDYHLRSGSPAVNSGSNQDWMSDALDLDGNPRIFGRQVDMGCYEFPNGFGTLIFLQ